MFSEWETTWSGEPGGLDRASAWENLHDDGARLGRLAYHHDLLRLDECGPPVEDGHVL